MRMVGGMMAGHYEQWWEASTHFLHANSNKLGITLDLSKPRGLELLEELIPHCDAIVDNFTPRVLDNFGLSWERVKGLNPKALMLRMPAFGLSGPWRDHTGFAQTMEQLSGLAWLTGHLDDQPRIPRGPCDPVAGLHATFAFLVALVERGASGHGHHVESTMVESALNIARRAARALSLRGRTAGNGEVASVVRGDRYSVACVAFGSRRRQLALGDGFSPRDTGGSSASARRDRPAPARMDQ
jgi:crotonobetainyl-CoA:carnitine CoA-transferase CaiB-like acyl-CoA transferase